MTKPLPDCGRSDGVLGKPGVPSSNGLGSDGGRRRRAVHSPLRVVASMFTTAGLMRSATSAKFTRLPAARAGSEAARTTAGRGCAGDRCGCDAAGAGATEPATMSPIMKDIIEVSANVTKAKGRDIFSFQLRAASFQHG